jgi:hypothetical protein
VSPPPFLPLHSPSAPALQSAVAAGPGSPLLTFGTGTAVRCSPPVLVSPPSLLYLRHWHCSPLCVSGPGHQPLIHLQHLLLRLFLLGPGSSRIPTLLPLPSTLPLIRIISDFPRQDIMASMHRRRASQHEALAGRSPTQYLAPNGLYYDQHDLKALFGNIFVHGLCLFCLEMRCESVYPTSCQTCQQSG